MKTHGTHRSWLVSALALSLAVAGCDQPVGLDGQAQVETEMEGGPAGQAASDSSPTPSEPATTSEDPGSSEEVRGSVDVRARVLVQAVGGEWRDASGGTATQQLRIDGSDGLKLFARTGIEADEYVRVRVEFEAIEADVESGLWAEFGELTGEVGVDLGTDGKVIVEREIHFEARANSRTRIRVALNAAEWLERVSLGARAVSEADFRSAVAIQVD